jgi:hypothetical protein
MPAGIIDAFIQAKEINASQSNDSNVTEQTPDASAKQPSEETTQVAPVTQESTTEPVVETIETPALTQATEESVTTEQAAATEQNAGTIVDISTSTDTETPVKNFSDVLSQQYNGRFKTQKDLDDFISKADKPRIEYANEFTASLDNAVKNGQSAKDFTAAYFLNTEEMTDREAIKQMQKLKNSSLTDRQLDRIVSKKYDVGEDAEKDEIEDAKISETMDGGEAKRYLKEYRDKYIIDVPNVAQSQQKTRDDALTAAQDYANDMNAYIDANGNHKIEVSLNDKLKYAYTPTQEDINAARNMVTDIGTFWKQYEGKDGKAKFYQDQLFLANREKIMRNLAEAINNDGKKFILKKIDNPSSLDSSNEANVASKSIDLQAAEQFFQ